MQYRYDSGEISRYEMTPEGYLRAEATVARIGVQTYYDSDGSERSELRPPEEVSDPDSLASFGLKCVTVDHPPEFLDATNTKSYQVGGTDSTVVYRKGFVDVVVQVTDSSAIEVVSSGEKRQLSAGYTCDLDFTPGTWRGKKYDAIQRNIRCNHVSLVNRGRAGPEVKLHLDAWESRPIPQKVCTARLDKETKKVNAMSENESENEATASEKEKGAAPEVKADAKERRIDELTRRVKELELRVDDRDSTIVELTKQNQELKDKSEALRLDASQLKSELESNKKRYESAVSDEVIARFDAWNLAKPFLPKALAEKPDPSMTADEIKRSAIENTQLGVKLDGVSSDYIDGWFKSMISSGKKKDKPNRLMGAVAQAYNSKSADARTKAQQEDDEAWKKTNC